MIEPVRLNTFRLNPVKEDVSLPASPAPEKAGRKTPAGVADVPTKMIRQTPAEMAKEIDLLPLKPSRKEAVEVLDELMAVNQRNFPDTFNFEKTMVLYYKAMVACLKGETETMVSTMRMLEKEIEKIGDERQKEYQKIADRMGRQKWFNAANLGGIVAGGIVGSLSSGGSLAPAILAGTAVLGLMQIDEMANHPFKNLASHLLPESVVSAGEFVLGVGGAILFGLNPASYIPASVGGAVSQIGTQYTAYQNNLSDGDLERLTNMHKGVTDQLDSLNEVTRFVTDTLKNRTQMMNQIIRQPRIFN